MNDEQRTNSKLFKADCFGRTTVNAYAAINAGIADHGFALSHTDSFTWAVFHTGLATRAFAFIYFSRHLCDLSEIYSFNLTSKRQDVTKL